MAPAKIPKQFIPVFASHTLLNPNHIVGVFPSADPNLAYVMLSNGRELLIEGTVQQVEEMVKAWR